MSGLQGIAGSLWGVGVLGGLDRQQELPDTGLKLPPPPQTRVPNACLGSAELLLWPGQAPRVVSISILLLTHGGWCPQALGPEQDPGAPGSLGPQPCRDRKGVRRPGGNAAAQLQWITTVGMEG